MGSGDGHLGQPHPSMRVWRPASFGLAGGGLWIMRMGDASAAQCLPVQARLIRGLMFDTSGPTSLRSDTCRLRSASRASAPARAASAWAASAAASAPLICSSSLPACMCKYKVLGTIGQNLQVAGCKNAERWLTCGCAVPTTPNRAASSSSRHHDGTHAPRLTPSPSLSVSPLSFTPYCLQPRFQPPAQWTPPIICSIHSIHSHLLIEQPLKVGALAVQLGGQQVVVLCKAMQRSTHSTLSRCTGQTGWGWGWGARA